MGIERIRVEHMRGSGRNGLVTVIDIRQPKITWNVSGDEAQCAYRVKATGHLGTVYDSGRVEGRGMSCLLEADFQSRERIEAEVCLWGKNGSEWKVGISFEMGLLREADWQAKWIDPEQALPDVEGQRPASYLRKTFSVEKKAPARLYATAHGVYNVYLNGHHVEGFVMAPGVSQYEKRLQYQTYDVTELLREGENEIMAVLGNGWWRGTVTFDGIRNGFGEDVAFLAQLEADGAAVCVTDHSWQATQEGPLRDTDNMTGEVYDAARENLSGWHEVKTADFGYGGLCCSNCPPPLEHEVFVPELLTTPRGEQVLDFGQNLAGYIGFCTEGRAGEKWIFTHGEVLDGDGNFQRSNFQSPHFLCAQEIVYSCKEGENRYKAANTFMGFRYVKVEGMKKIRPSDFRAYAVYNDLEETASFRCGSELVNRLFGNAVWSIKGNLMDIPTDCPTREKSGFTGDLVTYVHTMNYLFDSYPMLRKFIVDQAAGQYEDGCVKQIVADPRGRMCFDGAAGWSDSFEILPECVGARYNDYSLFEEYYPEIRRWIDYCIHRAARQTRPENLENPWHEFLSDVGIHWGEWAEYGVDCMESMMFSGHYGNPEVATAYLARGCEILAKQAGRMGRREEESCYRETADKAKKAYRHAFLRGDEAVADGYEAFKLAGGEMTMPADGDAKKAVLSQPEMPTKRPATRRMCRYVRPVALNLVEEEDKKKLAARLDGLVRENHYRLNTGFLTTHELCRTLSDYGYVETAYRLLLNEECPGWLYSVKCGATTVPEHWAAYGKDGSRKDSFNHYSYGSVVGWLIDSAAGIRLEDGRITIAPKPWKELGFVECFYQSPLGRIASCWHYEGDRIVYRIEIPQGCDARLILPDGRQEELPVGRSVRKEISGNGF